MKSFPESELVEQVYHYCKDNLALVNVYMKSPVVTKIRSVCNENVNKRQRKYSQERPEDSNNLVHSKPRRNTWTLFRVQRDNC